MLLVNGGQNVYQRRLFSALTLSGGNITPRQNPLDPARRKVYEPAQPYAVSCPSANDCWVAGEQSFENSGGLGDLALIEHWNGSHFRVVSIPDGNPVDLNGDKTNGPTTWTGGKRIDGTFDWDFELHAISCPSTAMCIALGYGHTGGGPPPTSTYHPATMAYRWNGRRWTPQHVAAFGDAWISDISCASAHACMAVGANSENGSGKNGYAKLAAFRWNGHGWSPATPATRPNVLPGYRFPDMTVACVPSKGCMMSGTTPHGESFTERWNGNRWALLRKHHSGPEVTCDPEHHCVITRA